MTTQIANQTTDRILDLIDQAESAMYQARFEGDRDCLTAEAPAEVYEALREASEALHKARMLARQSNTAN